MGFDFERQRFTPENHRLFDQQVAPMVGEMRPGEVCFVDSEEILVDGEQKLWVFRYGSAWSDAQMVQKFEDSWSVDEEEENDLFAHVRLIRIEEGFIADYSHSDERDWSSPYNKFERGDTIAITQSPADYLPIISAVFNENELELLKNALAQKNIDLDPSEFSSLLERAGVELDADPQDDSDGPAQV